MRAILGAEAGSTLVITVVGLLLLAILGLSLALLAGLEARSAVDDKRVAQAETLAEAALARAAEELRPAVRRADGFSGWLGRALWAGPQTVAPYGGADRHWFRARVDNDCPGLGTVPNGAGELRADGRPCDGRDDSNGRAVLTGWAEVSGARARARALIVIDEPWRHVCTGHGPAPGGGCAAGRAGDQAPRIDPLDAGDPHGPASWTDLPRPYLGCSRIDPTLHRGSNPPASQSALCGFAPASPGRSAMFAYPYPPHLLPGEPRLVVMGADPAEQPGASVCNADPGGSGVAYFGHFDCALSSYCDPAEGHVCPGGRLRKGCVAAADSRGGPGDPHYVRVRRDGTGTILEGCAELGHTGMVFPEGLPDADVGSTAAPFVVYVLRGRGTTLRSRTLQGTLVVEGSAGASGCGDLEAAEGVRLLTGAAHYGTPLALLLYDPGLPPPGSAGPAQATCATLGPASPAARSLEIRGLVYAAGRLRAGAVTVDGSLVAWELEALPPEASLTYNSAHGDIGSPPGFPAGEVARLRLLRRTFAECATADAEEALGPTPCQ